MEGGGGVGAGHKIGRGVLRLRLGEREGVRWKRVCVCGFGKKCMNLANHEEKREKESESEREREKESKVEGERGKEEREKRYRERDHHADI